MKRIIALLLFSLISMFSYAAHAAGHTLSRTFLDRLFDTENKFTVFYGLNFGYYAAWIVIGLVVFIAGYAIYLSNQKDGELSSLNQARRYKQLFKNFSIYLIVLSVIEFWYVISLGDDAAWFIFATGKWYFIVLNSILFIFLTLLQGFSYVAYLSNVDSALGVVTNKKLIVIGIILSAVTVISAKGDMETGGDMFYVAIVASMWGQLIYLVHLIRKGITAVKRGKITSIMLVKLLSVNFLIQVATATLVSLVTVVAILIIITLFLLSFVFKISAPTGSLSGAAAVAVSGSSYDKYTQREAEILDSYVYGGMSEIRAKELITQINSDKISGREYQGENYR